MSDLRGARLLLKSRSFILYSILYILGTLAVVVLIAFDYYVVAAILGVVFISGSMYINLVTTRLASIRHQRNLLALRAKLLQLEKFTSRSEWRILFAVEGAVKSIENVDPTVGLEGVRHEIETLSKAIQENRYFSTERQRDVNYNEEDIEALLTDLISNSLLHRNVE